MIFMKFITRIMFMNLKTDNPGKSSSDFGRGLLQEVAAGGSI
jgi:hypothetical protein